jgi:sulfur relay (sulfurtransferase) complex TusBCD TusD component (DsrE family)
MHEVEQERDDARAELAAMQQTYETSHASRLHAEKCLEAAELRAEAAEKALVHYNMATNRILAGRPGSLRVGEMDALMEAQAGADRVLAARRPEGEA